MHPALLLENISKLPISTRAIAKRAANGSLDDLGRLFGLMTQLGKPDKRYLPAISVFFVNLDPSGIPTGEDLATDAVACAVLAINGLQVLADIPPSCGVDLWPRLWLWVEFIHSYRDYIPRAPTEAEVCFDLLLLMLRLSFDDKVAKMIDDTPGIRALATRSWAFLLQSKEKSDHSSLSPLCNFLSRHMKVSDPRNLEEVLDSAGGLYGLASLIVGYLELFIPDRQARLTISTLALLDGPLEVLADLNDTARPALMSAGIVPALTKIACAVGDAKIFGSAHLLHALLASIGVYFFPSPSYIGISQALAAGLLRAIINSGPMKETDEQTSAWHMLGVTLPASTVFYSVVAQLPAAFLEAKDLIDAPSLKSLPIYSLWQPFHAIAQERINLMQLFTSKKLVSSKACDTCGVIAPKQDFSRCSSCQQAYYCCTECQKLDWNRGDHRSACIAIRQFQLQHPEPMSPRNIAFMRTILHAANQFPAIRHARLQALRAHASRDFSFSSSMKKPEQLVTIFSFLSAGPPTVTVRRLSHVRAQDTMGDIYWDAYAARAAAGVGTIEMQVMMVLDGERQRLRMFTLRSSSPIGHSVESGGEGVVEINC